MGPETQGFLTNCWYVAAWDHELIDCKLLARTILEKWNYLHDYDLHDPTIALSLHHSMVEGFMEDKFIIEGQQEVLDADPEFRMSGIVSDAPLAHFRRTLGKLIEAEQNAARSPAIAGGIKASA